MVVIDKGYVYAMQPRIRRNVNGKAALETQSVYNLPPDPARPERNPFTESFAAQLLLFTEWQRRRVKSYTEHSCSTNQLLTGGKFNAWY